MFRIFLMAWVVSIDHSDKKLEKLPTSEAAARGVL